jgi:hypothetical protein
VYFEDGSEITMIINNNNSKRTTHFVLNGRVVPHTIINIPNSGVHIGVCIKNVFNYLFLVLLWG